MSAFKCRRCQKLCALVECPDWPAAKESACCRAGYYRYDLAVCLVCEEAFDVAEEGHVDEEGQATCGVCIDERCARELRQAHPAPPTTVNEYLKAKGRAA